MLGIAALTPTYASAYRASLDHDRGAPLHSRSKLGSDVASRQRQQSLMLLPCRQTPYFMMLSSALAVSVEEAGFWPVIRRPSMMAKLCQSSFFSNNPPRRRNSSSTRNGTTLVR